MKFLFSVRPYFGHFHPMAPFAAKLSEEGHDVVFATADPFCERVAAAGFRVVKAGHSPQVPTPPGVVDDTRLNYGTWVTRLKTNDLLAFAGNWRPQVIVREQTDFASILAAEVLQLPHATIGFAQFYPLARWPHELGPTLEILRHEYGLRSDPYLDRLYPYLYLSTVPPWFDRPRDQLVPTLVPIRPTNYDFAGPVGIPDWLDRLPERPLVYATLGTVYNKHRRFFSVVAEALAHEDVEVVCTVGPDQEPEHVVPCPPPNMHVARYIPHTLLYPRCAAIISHGGFSTVIGALCAGIPMVNVPHGSDQPGNADRTAELGAGLVLAMEDLDPDRIRAAVTQVLHEPGFRAAAGVFRDAVLQLPSVDHGARLLALLPDLVATETAIASYSSSLLRSHRSW